MKILSLFEDHDEIKLLEVEMALWPGLPDIHYVGGADPLLKEASKRIKSAIRAQGFQFLPHHQVLVNLRPSHFKKYSQGLDLAVAVGYLMMTRQIPPIPEDCIIYGELTLEGEVRPPDSAQYLLPPVEKMVLTGKSQEPLLFPSLQLKTLRDLIDSSRELIPAYSPPVKWRPSDEILEKRLSPPVARALLVAAVGKHRCLLAGPQGCGKTTAAKILNALLPPPEEREKLQLWIDYRRKNPHCQPDRLWRAFIAPHHTTPLMSLVGGGNQVTGGELARAHRGTLLLDEFLEFSEACRESLREPLENGFLRIARGSREKTYPLDCQIIATTNLCPCGEWVPGSNKFRACRFGPKKCRSYAERLSGPLLDRFEIVLLLDRKQQNNQKIVVADMVEQLTQMRNQNVNPKVTPELLSFLQNDPRLNHSSERRKQSLIRVATSAATLDRCEEVQMEHIQEVWDWVIDNPERLQKWDDLPSWR